jgi:CRP-like cAMP-binding protein
VLKSWRGGNFLLRTLERGDCFGEMALIDLQPRSASVRAIEDCEAIRLSAANLYQVYEKNVEQFTMIQMNLGREISRRLRDADERIFESRMGAPEAELQHVFQAS